MTILRAARLLWCVAAAVASATCASGGPGPAAPAAPPRPEPIPARPQLARGEDTCSTYAYYQYGLAHLQRDPRQAAAAFYWSQRISPTTAVAYYAERVALLMAHPSVLRHYVQRDPRVLQSAEVRHIDSLEIRAVALDPFFPHRLDEDLLLAFFADMVNRPASAIVYYLERAMARAGPEPAAELAFAQGDYRRAAAEWAEAVRQYSKVPDLHERRAHAFFLLGQYDSARVEMDTALAAARRSDAKALRFAYDSKALWEYELGRIEEIRGRYDAARDAYQQALVEDLSFYPAHLRLAMVAIHGGDTATALVEVHRALDLKEGDYSSQLALGTLEASRRATDSATAHLRRAAEIEPFVAFPHVLLGAVRLDAADSAGAIAEYRRFLALSAQSDPYVPQVRAQLGVLAPAPATRAP